MYNAYRPYQNPHYSNTPMHNPYMYDPYKMYPHPYWTNTPMYNPNFSNQFTKLNDYGPEPFVVNIEEVTKYNNTFRTALWTGTHLQLTLMSIDVGEDIGLEIHPELDQFIRIEDGQGLVKMGNREDNLDFQRLVYADYAFIIPAGKWHNLINTGNKPLKLYSIYAPPQHPRGTVHETKAVAQAAEENHVH